MKTYHIIDKQWYFNSQPHKEADERLSQILHNLRNFNSQPHKEADEQLLNSLFYLDKFQLTASQGG